MKVIEPSATILTPVSSRHFWETELCRLERIGRVCYQSDSELSSRSAKGFVRMIVGRGHESVLEHASMTVSFICDRGVSHELVRHRMAAFSQESTRYCKYKDEVTFIRPYYFCAASVAMVGWATTMEKAEDKYLALLDAGATAQEARAVLPNSLKTQVVMTANMREWRHVFKLRCSRRAHPQMRQVMVPLLEQCIELCPELFDDIKYDPFNEKAA